MDWLLGPKYKVWVINTRQKSDLYRWGNFKNLEFNLNTLIELAKEPAYIRTFQSFEFQNNWLGFGRMKWCTENNIKWTTKYIGTTEDKEKILFFSTEVWAPDWNYCTDKNVSPKSFIKIYQYESCPNILEGIIIAIPIKIVRHHLNSIESNIKSLCSVIPGATLSIAERRWTPSRLFPNRIEDMNPQEVENIVTKFGSA